jgi:hypothetical protein
MTTKTTYTGQEWEDLLNTPILAGSYIIVSDISVTAMPREMKGLFKAIMAQEAPAEAQELVAALVADLVKRSEQKENLAQIPLEGNQDPRPEMLAILNQSLAILDEKGDPGERAAFSRWLVDVAHATAEAGREGGFLGIGSVRVSEQEQAALAQLEQSFGLVSD